ncbi:MULTISPECIES: competence protein CoiA family protein [unclassified Burkholderia]|uniref:competence protein CoiA family protein n=1 Tax=unclassified Burkholderia TaxID=2613784 RepID=UPI002AB22F9F|nr:MULTISPECIES: competence protein CoiA family protein [unclassified Burkholderia]
MPTTSIGSAPAKSRDGRVKDAVFAHSASGVLVHVSEVPRGKACNCYCAACGSLVIAKKGNQTVWHFAHLSKADCLHAAETALHKAVKQVILEGDSIGLPDLAIEARASVGRHVGHAKRWVKGRPIPYLEPRLEVRIGEIVADAVITAQDRELIVEVAVTHKVDDEKLRKFARMQTPAIELEAWKLDRAVDWSSIRLFVSKSVESRKWLFNPRREHLLKEAQTEAQAQAQALADTAHMQDARKYVALPMAATRVAGDWQIAATTKLKRLWLKYRSDRLLTVTPSFAAADMIMRWDERDAHDGDEESHFESLLTVLAATAHITYRDENGVVAEFRQDH